MSETTSRQLTLFPDLGRSGVTVPSDQAARVFATDPRHNVVLEASAGTGKTSVLVARYLNLLRADVNPANVLAITFTRQAAAEMRGRIIAGLRADAGTSQIGRHRWQTLHDRLGEITISTVDAFCLSLLREYPLEAELDPGFGMADETEVPRLVQQAVDRALVVGAALAARDPGVAMVLAQLGPWRARVALTDLLERRLVVPQALHRFLAKAPRALSGSAVCLETVTLLAERLEAARPALDQLFDAGPADDPRFALVARDLGRLDRLKHADAATIRGALDRFREFFLTQKGAIRTGFARGAPLTGPARRRLRDAAAELAPVVRDVLRGFDRDLNVVMAQAVQRLFGIAVSEYRRCLDARALLDFSDVLQRAVELLRQMDEFARSRYRLESRYHHVLVDEFQDTSRAQWELVSLLVKAWGEGSGLVEESVLRPTIFIVGDRKQSIYRFRDADVSVLREAAREISDLRPEGDVHRSISHSFRAVPALLAFVNDLFAEIGASSKPNEGFDFETHDRFPVAQTQTAESTVTDGEDQPLGMVVAGDVDDCADAVADEVERLLGTGHVRSTDPAVTRAVMPGDIAVLFRARASHREFQSALERRSIPTYVYKGLGFFDADEIKDVRALLRFLANPASELRAAAFLRSRVASVSDLAVVALSGHLSAALVTRDEPEQAQHLEEVDRARLGRLRSGLATWRHLIDRIPPAELLDRVLHDVAYAHELHGRHVRQARENLKKFRGLIRRLENRGYATMARVSEQIDGLADDVSTAVVEAYDAVNFMTVHAAKGLEFPVVFLVDLGRGTRGQAPPVRVIPDRGDGHPSVSVWPYRTEVDTEERQRDLGETKRLLYVAATRARDRLYLSTALSYDGFAFNRGSFGEVLPQALRSSFERALTSKAPTVEWRAAGGQSHRFRAVTPAVRPSGGRRRERRDADTATKRFDLCRVDVPRFLERRTTTQSAHTGARDVAPDQAAWSESGEASTRVLGRVVHTLLEWHLAGNPSYVELERHARQLLRRELPLSYEMTDPLVFRAVDLFWRIHSDPHVRAVAQQDCLFEVPFSCYDPGGAAPTSPTLLSGTIDCVARSAEGAITVLEFKTGTARPEHQQQLNEYVAALRVLCPGAPVTGRVVYASPWAGVSL